MRVGIQWRFAYRTDFENGGGAGVKHINPQAYITGKVVGRADEYVKGDEFDGVTNYTWMGPVVWFFCPSAVPLRTSEFRKEMNALRRAYPKSLQYVVQKFFDSHDVGRILTAPENRLDIGASWESLFRAIQIQNNPV